MKSSPPLLIEFGRSRSVWLLWLAQLLVLPSLFLFLPVLIAVLATLVGGWLLLRAWPGRQQPGRLQLAEDGTVSAHGASTRLQQAQNYLGIVVLCLADGRVLWLWPDMLQPQQRCALLRWLQLHPAALPRAAGLQP